LTIFLILYFLSSILYGILQFEYTDSLHLFMHTESSSHYFVYLYNIMYFLLALFTLIAIVSVMFTLSLLSKSITGATTLCVGFILFSFIYPYLMQLMKESFYYYTSIIMIQYEGIAMILAGNALLSFTLIGILLGYIFISNYITFKYLAKQDYFN